MSSIYDNIKTAKDLIREVMVSGLSTKQEDICRVQDIFGHSTIEELVELANDNGRNDENGNPNPKGSWCGGRKGTYSTFYMVLFNIWNWEDATRFWNQHTNPDMETKISLYKQNVRLDEELAEYKRKCDNLKKDISELQTQRCEHMNKMYDMTRELTEKTEKLKESETQIIVLKARLFDMMEQSK